MLTYLFHIVGELGLSAVTQLAPKRYLGQMMGVWFMAAWLGYVIAGLLAGEISSKEAVMRMPERFMQVSVFVFGTALLMLLATPWVKKLMADGKH